LLGNGRKFGCGPVELAGFAQDNLRPPVVSLDLAMDLDFFPGKMTHIADVSQVAWKNHDREGTVAVVPVEIQEGSAAGVFADLQDSACNARRVADVVAGFADRQASGASCVT